MALSKETIYLQVRQPSCPGNWADYWLSPNDSMNALVAQGYIFAPHDGDGMMSLVKQRLQETAEEAGVPVLHEYFAQNKGSLELILRTPGYEFFGESATGHPIFTRLYKP